MVSGHQWWARWHLSSFNRQKLDFISTSDNISQLGQRLAHSFPKPLKNFVQRAMDEAREDEFPAPSRQASGKVNGIETQVTSLGFSDKIVITISQEGRLAQWVLVICVKASNL